MSAIELIVCLGAMGAFCGTGYVVATNVKTAVEHAKLDGDIGTLNAAVSTYLAAGGELDGVTTPEEVLGKLKSQATTENHHDREIMFVKKSLLDARVRVNKAPTAAMSRVTVWNAPFRRFETRLVGAGISRFDIDILDAHDPTAEETRRVVFKQAKRDAWVWDYQDEPSMARVPPSDQPTDIGPGTEVAPVPGPPPPQRLEAPVFSKPPGRYPLIDFPAAVQLSDPNPANSSRLYWSPRSQTWYEYQGAMEIPPGGSAETYAAALDTSEWTDSATVVGAWEAVPVKPQLAWAFAKPAYNYVEVGGPLLPGDYPTPVLAASGSLALFNGAEIPLIYQASRYFRPFWTQDGSDPVTSSSLLAGEDFAGGYQAPSLAPRLELWAGGTQAILRTIAPSTQPLFFMDADPRETRLGIEPITLRSPVLTPVGSSLRGGDEVTLAPASSHGDTPLGARLFYTTDGTDPGVIDGEPIQGTAYESAVKVPADQRSVDGLLADILASGLQTVVHPLPHADPGIRGLLGVALAWRSLG